MLPSASYASKSSRSSPCPSTTATVAMIYRLLIILFIGMFVDYRFIKSYGMMQSTLNQGKTRLALFRSNTHHQMGTIPVNHQLHLPNGDTKEMFDFVTASSTYTRRLLLESFLLSRGFYLSETFDLMDSAENGEIFISLVSLKENGNVLLRRIPMGVELKGRWSVDDKDNLNINFERTYSGEYFSYTVLSHLVGTLQADHEKMVYIQGQIYEDQEVHGRFRMIPTNIDYESSDEISIQRLLGKPCG